MINANDTAYPIGGKSLYQEDGLTKCEYFAAQAMKGLLAGANTPDDDVAECAVIQAKLLINALNRDAIKQESE